LKNANPRARPTVEALDLLCDLLRGPLDAEAAARFLSGRWIEALHALEKDGDDEDGAAMACAAAAVMPAECAEPFLAALAPFPDVFKQRAVLYRRFADALSGASHRTEFPAQTA
jgi:hypothetical protein